MNNLEDLEMIESYLNGQLSADERARFEAALRTDPAVANALTFYVLTKQAARQQAREEHQAHEQRRSEFTALRRRKPAFGEVPADARPLWSAPMRWAAAASVVLLLGLGWFFFQNGAADSVQMADAYITNNYGQLSTTMSGDPADRLKQGIDRYNQQKYAEAEAAFEEVLAQKPGDAQALKFAGLAAYQQGQYDQAVGRFHRLSAQTDLLDQSGPFLKALALIKRNQPMDKEQAKKLLERVIWENLDGKEQAAELLDQL